MMEQRTLNIINVVKGNTKYSRGVKTYYDFIRNYMADECMFKPEWYSDEMIANIVYKAMEDYIDHCNKPSFFMSCLKDMMDRHNCDIYHAICSVFNACVQVKDDNDNYVNGFDDRICALDKEGFE